MRRWGAIPLVAAAAFVLAVGAFAVDQVPKYLTVKRTERVATPVPTALFNLGLLTLPRHAQACLLDVSIPTSGAYDTLDRGPSTIRDDARPFAQRFGAGLRMITDLASPRDAMMMITPGQSGNPLSRHYRDLTPLWARGDYIPMITDRARLQGAQRLVLKPR